MSIFANIDKAQGSTPYLNKEGTYLLSICSCKQAMNHKNEGYFQAVLEVIESTNPAQPVGSKVRYYTKNTTEYFLSNVQDFIAGVMGCVATDVTQEVADKVVSESQPLEGKQVACVAYQVDTKKGGKFTVTDWMTPS